MIFNYIILIIQDFKRGFVRGIYSRKRKEKSL